MSNSKKPILNKLFESKNTHKEPAEKINKEEFIKTIKSRRRVRIYNDEPVLEKDMKECLELTLLAPNSSAERVSISKRITLSKLIPASRNPKKFAIPIAVRSCVWAARAILCDCLISKPTKIKEATIESMPTS